MHAYDHTMNIDLAIMPTNRKRSRKMFILQSASTAAVAAFGIYILTSNSLYAQGFSPGADHHPFTQLVGKRDVAQWQLLAVRQSTQQRGRSTKAPVAVDPILEMDDNVMPYASVDPTTRWPLRTIRLFRQDGYDIFEDDEDDDDDDDEFDLEQDNLNVPIPRNFLEESVSSFMQLQQSTGSEILQADLQQQIDTAAAVGADNFLEQQSADASYLEKVAMRSVTEQLPQAAVKALIRQQQQQRSTRKKSTTMKNIEQHGNLHFAGAEHHVTHEQELQLARLVQQGVALLQVRHDQEAALGRALTKQEWAIAVGVQSSKELRRRISLYRQAKHRLVTANMGLVHAVVQQQFNKHYRNSGISHEELVQEASLGLLRAAELFDPGRGLRFSTYAVVWIKGVLNNTHLPELVRVPAREKSKWYRIVQAKRDLMASRGTMEPSTVSAEELAIMAKLSVQDVVNTQRKMTMARSVLSLDYEQETHTRGGGDFGITNKMQNDKNFQEDADLAERTHMQADLIAALARNLDTREARLMRLRYGLSDGHARTVQECADAMGLSRTRILQLEKRCLERLRQAAEAESLEEYLLTIA